MVSENGQKMQAVEFLNPGENAEARVTPQPVPVPQTGEVLIRVHAAGINRPDLAQMAGRYPPPPGASTIPGLEVAGEVVAVNGETAGLSEGDKVCALVSGGGYAEYCTAPALQCLPLPDGYDFIRAAALPENFFTVWVNLFEHGRLQRAKNCWYMAVLPASVPLRCKSPLPWYRRCRHSRQRRKMRCLSGAGRNNRHQLQNR